MRNIGNFDVKVNLIYLVTFQGQKVYFFLHFLKISKMAESLTTEFGGYFTIHKNLNFWCPLTGEKYLYKILGYFSQTWKFFLKKKDHGKKTK